jgi:hypothetical protein
MTYSSTILADGAVAYWRLGESSGTNANDEVGTNDGTYTGTFTLGATGAIAGNTAVSFDGTASSYVRAGSVTLASSHSWEAWVNPASSCGWAGLVGAWDGEWGSALLIANDRTVTFYLQTGSVGPSSAVSAAAWHHVVGTYDGSQARLYIDGALAAGPTSITGPANSGATPVEMGAYNNGAGALIGTLDEAALYDACLTLSQVQAHYAAASGTQLQRFIFG